MTVILKSFNRIKFLLFVANLLSTYSCVHTHLYVNLLHTYLCVNLLHTHLYVNLLHTYLYVNLCPHLFIC
jgi:hypothetical protein